MRSIERHRDGSLERVLTGVKAEFEAYAEHGEGRDNPMAMRYVPGIGAGQRYGYRVHGEWDPEEGLRHNPAKLLVDPYARHLDGTFQWNPALYDYKSPRKGGKWRINRKDSAPYVPLSVVSSSSSPGPVHRPVVPWSNAVIYEANVRGYTMRHPDIPQSERGRFRGMSNGRILEYLKALGITSLELMPVNTMIDEIKAADLYRQTSQSFVVLLPVQSVGVMGDARTYENAVAIRCVDTDDFMTADWSRLPDDLLAQVANQIVNEVDGVNRVVYDITSKPPATIEWE